MERSGKSGKSGARGRAARAAQGREGRQERMDFFLMVFGRFLDLCFLGRFGRFCLCFECIFVFYEVLRLFFVDFIYLGVIPKCSEGRSVRVAGSDVGSDLNPVPVCRGRAIAFGWGVV